MSPPVEVPDAAVRALLRRWFPGRHSRFERLDFGVSTPVYRVTVDDSVTYLRLAEEPGERREGEVRVHELLRERGLPVPGVLRFDLAPPELDRSAALTAAIPGRPIDRQIPLAALRQIGRLAGRDLATINSVLVDGYGWVDRVEGEDRRLVAEHRTRAAWVAEYLAAAETVIASGIVAGALAGTLRTAVGAWAALPDCGSSRLAHGDFDASHIYADPDMHAYTGIIDFGEIRGADPLYDLGHVLVHAADAVGRELFEAVLAGYGTCPGLPPDAGSRIREQAIAIATRALAVQLGRPANAYRETLLQRLETLLEGL